MRLKSNSQHLRWTSGPQQQGTVNLSCQETTRLALPLACLECLKGLAPVEDQFRMSVWDHPLRRGVLAVVFQNPKGMNERTEPGRRGDLAIPNHLAMIAGNDGRSDAELAQMMVQVAIYQPSPGFS